MSTLAIIIIVVLVMLVVNNISETEAAAREIKALKEKNEKLNEDLSSKGETSYNEFGVGKYINGVYYTYDELAITEYKKSLIK